MRSHDVGIAPTHRDTEYGWEVALPCGSTSLKGVQMAGFRDRAATGLDMRVLPQPAVVVVIGFGDGPVTVDGTDGTDAERRRMSSFVAGLSPGPALVRGERVACVEVRLSPRTAYGLLGVSPRELDGSVVALEDLWGPRAQLLAERLAENTTTWRQRLAVTEEYLIRRAAALPTTAPAMAPEVAATWEALVTRRGLARVGDLADACGWSRRRLWARFTDQVGLTPKRAAMLIRFDHAARALGAGGDLTDVALTCGYADQSHLHRDVRALAGCTPRALAHQATSAN